MPVLTGEQIHEYRLLTLCKGLELECKGLQLSRGRSCYQIIKAEFGLKGSKQKVLEQFRASLTVRPTTNHPLPTKDTP